MSIKEIAEFNKLKDYHINDILEYIEDGNVAYTKADVNEYKRILEEHFEKVLNASDGECGIECVKNTALELSKLRQKAGEKLSETYQEDLCGHIVLAGVLLGLAYRHLK